MCLEYTGGSFDSVEVKGYGGVELDLVKQCIYYMRHEQNIIIFKQFLKMYLFILRETEVAQVGEGQRD